MALKKVTLSGVIICCGLYAVFHTNTKTPEQNVVGTWQTKNSEGKIIMTLKSNYLFDCDMYDIKTTKNTHYKGNWEMTGASINTETNEPPDAMLELIISDNRQLINHRITKINDHELIIQKTDKNTALIFKR